ncbi:NDR1/HIN1-like protein 3 [Cicer arietinum]|uniref:NDR1/HIN1-like protein 3 n=1 Tax=Cicer arietinum TaxID=3827 RepID=A0A1S2Y176_CICAR|nr:NDR1/HIN1-like protein 3 [Cicer arietinum]
MAVAQPNNRSRRCCCCLFNIIWKLLIAIIILVVLIILIIWLIVQPRAFKFSVKEAKLTQFNYLNNNNTLRYNLVLNFTARNPNKKLNIYYDKVEGHVSYDGTRFASTDVITWLNSFRQYTKSTNSMNGVFSGKRVVVFDQNMGSDFERDKKDGIFRIDVKLYFTIRFRLGDFIGGYTKGNIKCGLDVPFGSNGTKVFNVFEPTTCDVTF